MKNGINQNLLTHLPAVWGKNPIPIRRHPSGSRISLLPDDVTYGASVKSAFKSSFTEIFADNGVGLCVAYDAVGV